MVKKQNKIKCNKGQNSKLSSHSNEELELSLEVEIDEEVKEIIKSPKRCASALLDVTVIKPEDVKKLFTIHKKTLKGCEVKKLIQEMNLNKNDLRKIVENMLEANKGKSAGDADNLVKRMEKNELNGKVKNLLLEDGIFSDEHSSGKFSDKVNHVYTTPKTYHELNSLFKCKNKHKKENGDEKKVPCPCANCAIVGVVTDSQKRPFATESTYDPRDKAKNKTDSSKKRRVTYYPEEHIECEHYFKYLSSKIKTLEARLSAQEERAVPKEYFRKIIAKLVSNITKISKPSQENISSSSRRSRDPHYKGYSTDDHSYENIKHHTKTFVTSQNEVRGITRPSSKKTSSSLHDTQFWKWGEEVLRPGIDIKNKIAQLLEETIKNLKWSKPPSAKCEMKDAIDEISQDMYKTVRDIPEKEEAAYKKKVSYRKRSSKGASSVNVSYINPTQWDESQMSLIVESEGEHRGNSATSSKPIEFYQSEFKKMISNTKEEDRFHLWQNIWCQALSNGQKKDDTVTIQIPDKRSMKKQRNIEIEFTIAELEALLLGKN